MLKVELAEDQEQSLAYFLLKHPYKKAEAKPKHFRSYKTEVQQAFNLIRHSYPYAKFAREIYHLSKEHVFKSWSV